MALIRIVLVLLVIAFAGMIWFKPDMLIALIDPAADRSKAWLEQRSERIVSSPEAIEPGPVATPEITETAERVETPATGVLLPAPAIPEVVMVDAPELPSSLRAAGFVANHSSKPDLPNIASFTPDPPEASVEIQSIVGGVADNIEEVPWLVGIQIHTEIVYEGALAIATETCGGGVYDRRFIVTAAHCVEGDYNEIEVIAGSTSLENDNAVRRVSQRAFLHAGYERDVLREDIGIIELSEPLPDYIPTAPWPTEAQALAIPSVETVTGRGFGLTETGLPSNSLKKVELDVQESTLRVIRVADGGDRVQGLCQGDSGTPVTAEIDGSTVVIGMVSFTEAVPGAGNCSTPGFVAGLVSLEGYIDDIRGLVNLCSTEPEKCDA